MAVGNGREGDSPQLTVALNGTLLGILLLVVVGICAFLLARKAAQNVAQFREDEHERFKGPPKESK